ncbi:class I SAM-dependent methyltransferase [Streptomyces sp. NPDC087440]|uniref:class I SAM-dependent methyltransferase n=1 Tax=Streptomyces sp. NPDC087440 TaxID=3365790 RepID=UPI0038023E9D
MTERARSFGAAAAAYERFRPGYPAELFELVAAYAGRPPRTALEIGAGTGKATRLFAGRGVAVTATDPDPAMLAELRTHVPDGVRTVCAAYEDVPTDQRYDLVYAAAALHWTTPEGRWERTAALLEPGGVFTSFGGQFHLADPAVEEAVRSAQAPYLDSADVLPPGEHEPEPGGMAWPGPELRRARWFTDVRQHTVERRPTLDAGAYVDHLSTVSAYLVLPAAERAEVFRRVRAVLPGTVGLVADITVHLARRSTDGSG